MVATPACWRLSVLAAAAWVISCGSPETAAPPLAPPRVEIVVLDRAGAPGGAAVDGAEAMGGALVVDVAWRAVASPFLPTILAPVVDVARLVTSSASPTGTRSTPRLLRGTRVGSSERLGESLPGFPLGHLRSALLPGGSTSFAIVDLDARADEDGPVRRRAVLTLRSRAPRSGDDSGAAAPLELALSVEGRDPRLRDFAADDEDAAARRLLPVPAPATERETIFVEGGPVVGGPPHLVVMPFPFARGSWATLIARITVRLAADEDAELVADAVAAADAAAETRDAVSDGAKPPSAVVALDRPSLVAAWGGLARHSTRRGALLYAAAGTGAALAEDVALTGSDALLGELAACLVDALGAEPRDVADVDPAAVGWLLDRHAIGVLIDLVDDGDHPEIDALLTRHAGEMGRDPAALADLAANATDGATFRRRVVAENVLALEDSSPGTRVRAFDWLRARGLAPDDFDPLAASDARRAALRRWAKGKSP